MSTHEPCSDCRGRCYLDRTCTCPTGCDKHPKTAAFPDKIQRIVDYAEERNLEVSIRTHEDEIDGLNGPVRWTMVYVTIANNTQERFGENGLNDGSLHLTFVVHGNRVKFKGGWRHMILLKKRRVWKYSDVYGEIRMFWLPAEHRTVPAYS